ncbi:MAG: 50S ribosomal protein L25 [Treponema sp.]|nr:50S ribosomal protein L25 [Treponema sp.]
MGQVVFKAQGRTGNGSVKARRVRRIGRIPGVLYGRSGKAISIDLDAREFTNGIRNISESTIVKLEVDGKSFDAFVKDTQRNIRDGNILHVDFYEVESGVVLRARVSIHLKGNAVGVRDGGILEFPLHEVEVECLPQYLPERIDLDISNLGTNQSIHVRDLVLDKNVRVLSNNDQVITLVKYAKEEAKAEPTAEEVAAAEAAAAAAPGAAPAAGTAGAAAPGTAAPAAGAAAAAAAPKGKDTKDTKGKDSK